MLHFNYNTTVKTLTREKELLLLFSLTETEIFREKAATLILSFSQSLAVAFRNRQIRACIIEKSSLSSSVKSYRRAIIADEILVML